ncbi:hypothetical protein NQZ68_004052 [Dissostichus eleginoides]|nr:hypothetical protein NQZ68_004052 [Dissostichus eleginoides]
MLICGRRRGRRRSMRKKKDVTLCTFAACRRNAEETKEEKSLHVTEAMVTRVSTKRRFIQLLGVGRDSAGTLRKVSVCAAAASQSA